MTTHTYLQIIKLKSPELLTLQAELEDELKSHKEDSTEARTY